MINKKIPSKICITLLVFFLLAGIQTAASSADRGEVLAFADYLFETGEYYRAITEYYRFLFFFPGDQLVKLVQLKIAYAYQKGEQWEDALKRFEALAGEDGEYKKKEHEEIRREAFFQVAETLRLEKKYQQAILQYREFIKAFPKDKRLNQAFFRIGCLQLELHKWLKASEAFSQVKSDSRFFAAHLAEEAKHLASLPLKKPALAGTLSAVIPGAGQMYAQRYRDGLSAFVVNTGFIWGAAEAFHQDQNVLGSILLLMEFGWYAGNIYSAINSTEKFNKRKIEKKLTPLRERCSLSFKMDQRRSRKYQLSFHVMF